VVRRAASRGLEVHAVLRPTTDAVRLETCRAAVTVHRLDVADSAALAGVVAAARPRSVVMAAFPPHTLQWTPRLRRSAANTVVSNMISIGEALRAAPRPIRLVLVGSLMVYGRGGEPRTPGQPPRPQMYRGALKAAESAFAWQLAEEHGYEFAELRVGSAYGPYQPHGRALTALMRAALRGERIPLSPDPVLRDWIYFDDVASACLAATDRLRCRTPLVANIASGELRSLRELVAIAEQVIGRPLAGEELDDIRDGYGDVEPALLPGLDELDWQPTLSPEQGIRAYLDWAYTPFGRRYLLGPPPR
jgi:nucleoside-diphosphate-sugar epimerase